MQHISKNGAGLAAFIVLAFGYFGVELETDSVVDLLAAAGLFGSAAMSVWNQLNRQDVKWFFWKE
jgi:hypothetical protein